MGQHCKYVIVMGRGQKDFFLYHETYSYSASFTFDGNKGFSIHYTKMKFSMNSFHATDLSLSIPPENIKKSEIFRCFQGVQKEKIGMKWVKNYCRFIQIYQKSFFLCHELFYFLAALSLSYYV